MRWWRGRGSRARSSHHGPSGQAVVYAFVPIAAFAIAITASSLRTPWAGIDVSDQGAEAEATAELAHGEPDDAPDVGGAAAPSGDTLAQQLCEARLDRLRGPDDPFNARVLAAYSSTVGDAASEHERQRPGRRSELRGRQPEEFAAVCFFEADAFGIPARLAADLEIPDSARTRVQEVVLLDSEAYGIQTGRAEVVPRRPSGSD